jgi:UDP-N-acetylglucosamine 2-epimerase
MADTAQPHILILAGTRPEAIKMAPVVRALRASRFFRVTLCATGQHRELLARALADFSLVPDENLDVMSRNQSLAQLSSSLFAGIDAFLASRVPDWMLVQGDTTTVMVAALCAFYRRIRVAHVEAGLRTGDTALPFPEEMNRRIATLAATLHFAPTAAARDNLLREGIDPRRILLTGNTVVDALLGMRDAVRNEPACLPAGLNDLLREDPPIVLITAHRRESFGAGLERICHAVRTLADTFPETYFIHPLHLNPNAREPANRLLSGRRNVILVEPLPYKAFVALMDRATLLLTDSGGMQEEAAVLQKPALVMRETTERPEGIAAGAAKLVGTDPQRIVEEAAALLREPERRQAMARAGQWLYGDGKASGRICGALINGAL